MRSEVRRAVLVISVSLVSLLAGCRHKQQVASAPPPPPAIPRTPATATPPPPSAAAPPAAATSEESETTGKPIYSEIGIASWYGPPYHNRPGANGQIYNQNAMTAAHRTLPMGSLIRVTNLATGQSAVVRVTDRGPFVPDRTVDLSLASAKAIGVWRPGTARVRVDVYEAPKEIDRGGRWCVQVGAFLSEGNAKKLEGHLERMYRTANVIEFKGPTGHWVRIRPLNDDRAKATEIAQTLRSGEDDAHPYLVRLD